MEGTRIPPQNVGLVPEYSTQSGSIYTQDPEGRTVRKSRRGTAKRYTGAFFPEAKVPARALTDYHVSRVGAVEAQKVNLPRSCPDWFLPLKNDVFSVLAESRRLLQKRTRDSMDFISGLDSRYNDLVLGLLKLEKAIREGEFDPDQIQTIAGWLDHSLALFPVPWRDLPLVVNTELEGWQLSADDQEFQSVIETNFTQYLEETQRECYLPLWMSKVVHGIDLATAYLYYHNIRHENVTPGKQPLTAASLFKKNDMLYDWLVLFQDKKTVCTEFGLSEYEYQAVCKLLDDVDEHVAAIPRLKAASKFPWKSLKDRPGMEERVQARMPASFSDDSSSSASGQALSETGDSGSASGKTSRASRHSLTALTRSTGKGKQSKQQEIEYLANKDKTRAGLLLEDGSLRPLRPGECYRYSHYPSENFASLDLLSPTIFTVMEGHNMKEVKEVTGIIMPHDVPETIPQDVQNQPDCKQHAGLICEIPLEKLRKTAFEVILPAWVLQKINLECEGEEGDRYRVDAYTVATKVRNRLQSLAYEKAGDCTEAAQKEAQELLQVLDSCFQALKCTLVTSMPEGQECRLAALEELSRLRNAASVFVDNIQSRGGRRADDEDVIWGELWKATHTPGVVLAKAFMRPEALAHNYPRLQCSESLQVPVSHDVLELCDSDIPEFTGSTEYPGKVIINVKDAGRLLVKQFDRLAWAYKDSMGVWAKPEAKRRCHLLCNLMTELQEYCQLQLLADSEKRKDQLVAELVPAREDKLATVKLTEEEFIKGMHPEFNMDYVRQPGSLSTGEGKQSQRDENMNLIRNCYAFCFALQPKLVAFAAVVQTKDHSYFWRDLDSQRRQSKKVADVLLPPKETRRKSDESQGSAGNSQ